MLIEDKQSVSVLFPVTEQSLLKIMSVALCAPYKKEPYDEEKTKKLIGRCVKNLHESVLEHCNITVDCTTTIGTYKDYTRHRHCAFTIESTNLARYADDLHVITCDPLNPLESYALENIHTLYKQKPQTKGRDFLPQCCSARMVMTTNVREFRHIIGIRGDPSENPLTRELRDLLWTALNLRFPFFFPLDKDGPMTLYNKWGGTSVPCSLGGS